MKHRIEIDGLRALAILPVLFYHAGFAWMPGGFLGVDVFFVISGFLITGILVAELHSRQSFSIVGFYERRARRIMPALFLVLAVSFPLAWFTLLPSQMQTFGQSVQSILYFGSNYFFLAHTGYFDPDIDLNPMVHTWSLSIEEQFYVVFPWLLWLLWRFFKEKTWILVLSVAAVASLVLAQNQWYLDSSSTFYQLQYRAWELLAGGIAAIWLSHVESRRISNGLSALGVIMIVVSMFAIGTDLPHPGFITLVPVLGTVLVIVFTGEGTYAHRLLSLPPLVWIGLVSYSAYLWHQPLFAFYRVSAVHPPTPVQLLPLIGLTFLLSYLSWKFVENPVRDRRRFNRRTIFIATLIGALALATTAYGLTRGRINNSRSSFAGVKLVDLEKRIRTNHGLSDKCVEFVGDNAACRTSAKPEVLLWGDSYAMHLAYALKYSRSNPGFIQQTLSACVPILGLAHQKADYGKVEGQQCIDFNDAVFKWLRSQTQIKYVILASSFASAMGPEGQSLTRDGAVVDNGSMPMAEFRKTLREIEALGKKVVVVLPTPTIGEDNGQCVIRSVAAGTDVSACDFPLADSNRAALSNQVAEVRDTAAVFSLDSYICPDGICHAATDGVIIYRDPGHLSYEGSKYLGEQYDFMGAMLRAADRG